MELLRRALDAALEENDLVDTVEVHDDLLVIHAADAGKVSDAARYIPGVKTISVGHVASDETNNVIRVDGVVYKIVRSFSGLGGLPTGLEGRVIIMISSGLDSPVAAFKAIRRGCVPIFVHFDNSPYSDQTNRDIAIKQARELSKFVHGVEVKMYVVPHGDDLTEVLRHAPRKMTCVFCRRNMYRLAREVALRENADAIITGEIIGEQASQTTRNLLAETSSVCDIPVIRPCIGDDKVDIERISREIDTYKFASEATACCVLPPKYPSVHARLEEIPPVEEQMDIRWIQAEVNEAETIILKEAVMS